jgi:hypothetical protein
MTLILALLVMLSIVLLVMRFLVPLGAREHRSAFAAIRTDERIVARLFR